MAANNFEFTGLVASAATASTNPIPTSLSTPNPYPTNPRHPQDLSPAWLAQGIKAIAPNDQSDVYFNRQLALAFIPSAGASATYTIIWWKYCFAASTWLQAKNSNSVSYTGPQYEYLQFPGTELWYPQVSAISSGTLLIRCDARVGTPL